MTELIDAALTALSKEKTDGGERRLLEKIVRDNLIYCSEKQLIQARYLLSHARRTK